MRPTESGANSPNSALPVRSNGTATPAATTATANSNATSHRPRSSERGKPGRVGAAGSRGLGGAYAFRRRAASSRSFATRMNRTGRSRPFRTTSPRSSYRPPSTRRARWTTSRLARISPGPAWPQRRAAPVAASHRHRLAGVQPDPHGEREGRVRDGLLDEALLELDRGPDGLPGGVEDGEGLVSPQLDHRSTPGLDALLGYVREASGELGGRLIAALLREERVPADVRDEEGSDRRPGLHARKYPLPDPAWLGSDHTDTRCPRATTCCRPGLADRSVMRMEGRSDPLVSADTSRASYAPARVLQSRPSVEILFVSPLRHNEGEQTDSPNRPPSRTSQLAPDGLLETCRLCRSVGLRDPNPT